MGLFDSKDDRPVTTTSAPAPQPDGALDKMAQAFIGRLMNFGIDGIGPVDSAAEVVAKARKKHGDNVDKAIQEVVSDHVKAAGVGGFLTGFGGLVTMPVSLPANVLEFYTIATRMVASIAELRGYEVKSEGARAAVLLTLVGADADDLIAKAGLSAANLTGSGRLARLAVTKMPKAAGMMINKAVGFRLLTSVGGKALSRFIRFVPVAGGIVGAGLDGLLMKRIADHARTEFAARVPGEESTAIAE
ncbi:MAG: EcsC family protein [Ornithinimicrobium sp.]|uniref:EcsC family protein n=1 Tax=Ornithinimicrobium sp. TaxID=1977084 RepID=UPI0026DEE493|nr:EcsC family protein [Ornithinimicrobium sp.]MDO5740179.1 EcsC family protein [Ornithinimicrobium sp.]